MSDRGLPAPGARAAAGAGPRRQPGGTGGTKGALRGVSRVRRRPRWRAAAALLAGWLAAGPAWPLSGMGSVRVLQAGADPCFALPAAGEAGMRLHALSVTHGERNDWRSLPEETWGFVAPPAGLAIDTAGDGRIRFGALPAGATVRGGPLPLQPHRLYRVEINAQPAAGRSGTVGYQAEFCMLPAAGNSAPRVQAVPWDEAAGRWRREVCAPR